MARHHFMLWAEWTANAGPNEVLSTLYHLLNNLGRGIVGSGVLNLIFDSCPVNKNQYICGFANELSDPSSPFYMFRRVDLKMPVVGHSFIEPDTGFSTIESKFAKTNPRIDQPADWEEFIKRCWRGTHPQYVGMVDQKVFKDWKAVLEKKYSVIGKQCLEIAGEKSRFKDMSWMTFGECNDSRHCCEMWFRYSLNETAGRWYKINIMKQGVRRTTPLTQPQQAYRGCIKLDAIKTQTLFEYRPFLPQSVWALYPPADPAELARERRVQAEKREARRNILGDAVQVQDVAAQSLLEEMNRNIDFTS
jgi:hypothetical protein